MKYCLTGNISVPSGMFRVKDGDIQQSQEDRGNDA
jgi:hypothetical protein